MHPCGRFAAGVESGIDPCQPGASPPVSKVTRERISSVSMLRILTALLLALSPAFAAAEPSLPLPALAPCADGTRPHLPDRWRAAYLMAPFSDSQLVLGELAVDRAVDAMRVTLHGTERGSADLLVSGTRTYVLSERSGTTQCRAIGDTGWRPLPADWLAPRSQCVGAAPLATTDVQWWKSPVEGTRASAWMWYASADRPPFRLLFPFPSDRLAPLGRYALHYRVGFEPQADLGAVVARCASAPSVNAAPGSGEAVLRRLLDGMARAPDRADRELRRLMPSLNPDCHAPSLPRWPHRLALTGMMTPLDFDENPYPAEVLYDWAVPAQRSRIFGSPDAAFVAQDSLLLGRDGFTVTWRGRGAPSCEAVVPGTLRPDWALRAPCRCAAAIDAGTPLSTQGPTRILACPLARPRVAWAWYAASGRPTTFAVTSLPNDGGKGLFSILDYRDWRPGFSVPASAFEKPPQCTPASAEQVSRLRRMRCGTCHLGAGASP